MTISRRQFCAAMAAAGLSATALPVFADDKNSQPLRVIAYNVYVCKGWPDDRPLAKKAVQKGQMARRLAMELALYEPDIINFSESPSEAIAKEVAGYLGMNHVRFPSGGNWPGTLLSKFEITASENVPLGFERPKELFTRHWGRGTVRLPNGEPLIIHSAHLYPGPDPTIRLKEIPAMLDSMKDDLDTGRSMLLIGDLNHGPDTEEYKLWIDAGWTDTFAKVGKGDGLTIKADKPEYRIDYVMAAGPIAKQISESRPLFEGAFRLNVADENSFALSDHLPQLAVFGEDK
jgi:endonuclease/exonuclease/phosphatase family metal-dependent hydrolase